MNTKSRRIISTLISAVISLSSVPTVTAHGEDIPERYPYTFFAGSSDDGAITINSDNICINGNIATNGTILSNAQFFNVNGVKKENVQEEVKLFFDKIDERYFSSHVDTYFEDYCLEDTNININIPIEAAGDIDLTGNINITTGIKALNDVNLSGNVENTQDSVICAENGDITINTDNVNLNGLVYAPNGHVSINAQNLNINSVIIIADTITITCPNLNANHNVQMADFIGNDSEPVINNDDAEPELVAYGDFDANKEIVNIYWNTTVPDGSFDILLSDDGEKYTPIGTVLNDDSYEYSPIETFDKKYIKVVETTKSGKVCEAIPFVVLHTATGYDIQVLDSDEDGLPDIYEMKIGTDSHDTDTDNDGLTDYEEYVYSQTDPLVYDSVIEGTSDADIDTDEDGISNIDELTQGTYPWTPDTDNDGLSDYDELFVYSTDPLVADSDEDGIDDGSEIKLGLDPNAPATNGVPDGEYIVSQSIEADNSILSSVNTAESPYELSIDIKTNGDAEKELTVDESGYSVSIENDAMLGTSIDLAITDTCNPEEIVLKYIIKEDYTDNTLNKFSSLDEFNGIKRLNVFRFDEEQGMLLPVNTEFDTENNQLYAEVNETGTYCIMDMEIWLYNLGIETEPERTSPTPKPAPNRNQDKGSEGKPDYTNAPIDLVFILQTTGSDKSAFDMEKNLITAFSNYVFENNSDVNAYIITYDQYISKNRYSDLSRQKLQSAYEVASTLDIIKYNDFVFTYCDRSIAFNCLANDIPIRENADVFVYHFANGNTSTFYSSNDNKDVIQKVKSKQFKAYSEIATNGWHYFDPSEHTVITNSINANNDLFIDIYHAPLSVLTNHFESKKSEKRPVYDIIVPTKWKKITLNGELSPENNIDTDGDILTDWEEVDTTRFIWNADGSFEIPTFTISELIYNLNRFHGNEDYAFLTNDLTPRHYLPIFSDPTMMDSDEDNLNDAEDEAPLFKEILKNYLIYYVRPTGENKSSMEKPAKWMAEYAYDNKNCVLLKVSTVKEFIDVWNKTIPQRVNTIHLYLHGESASIDFYGDDSMMTEWLYDGKYELENKYIKGKLYLQSCNGGTEIESVKVGSHELISSARAFAKICSPAEVIALEDGEVDFYNLTIYDEEIYIRDIGMIVGKEYETWVTYQITKNLYNRYFVFYPLKHRGLGTWIAIKYDEHTKTFSKETLDMEEWAL